jgi:flagellin-like protein
MIGKSMFDDIDTGVSPVVGVILMVAITVILAAVIGTFVLDLGGNVNQNAQAGVNFDQSPNGQFDTTDDGTDNPDTTEYQVTVQVVDISGADSLTVQASDSDGTQYDAAPGDSTSGLSAYGPSVGTTTLSSVGDSSQVTQLTPGDTVTVTGTLDSEENVIQTYEVSE